MTTATLTAPRRTTAGPTSRPIRRQGSGPRLLLAPVVEPSARGVSRTASALTPPPLRSVLTPMIEASWPLAAPAVPPPTRTLPDPDQLCGSLVLAAVEVLGGVRPLVQLTRWVTPAVLETLTESLHRRPPSGPERRATIRRTHLCRISATAAEASVVVHDGTRVRAAAVRLEVHRGHWRATVLQIG